jgi:hypothetical protein
MAKPEKQSMIVDDKHVSCVSTDLLTTLHTSLGSNLISTFAFENLFCLNFSPF